MNQRPPGGEPIVPVVGNSARRGTKKFVSRLRGPPILGLREKRAPTEPPKKRRSIPPLPPSSTLTAAGRNQSPYKQQVALGLLVTQPAKRFASLISRISCRRSAQGDELR